MHESLMSVCSVTFQFVTDWHPATLSFPPNNNVKVHDTRLSVMDQRSFGFQLFAAAAPRNLAANFTTMSLLIDMSLAGKNSLCANICPPMRAAAKFSATNLVIDGQLCRLDFFLSFIT